MFPVTRVVTAFVGADGPPSFFAVADATLAVVVGSAVVVVEGVGGVVATEDATGTVVVDDVAPPLGVEPAPVPLPAFSPFVQAMKRSGRTRSKGFVIDEIG